MNTRELLKKSLPIILSQSSSVVMGLVNLIFISDFGYREIGVVGISNVFIQNALILLTSYTFQTSLNIVKVQRRKFDIEKEILNSLMIIAMIDLPIVILLVLFSNQILLLLGASGDLVKIGLTYFIIRLISTLFIAVSRVFIALFRGLGKNSLTMYVAILSNIINVLLNFVSVKILHFGLISLAFSLLISETIQIIVLMFFIKQEGFDVFAEFRSKIDIPKIKRVNFEGYKIALQDIGLALTSIVFNMFAAKIGTKELAATEILLNLLTITYLPGIGIGVISSIEVGEIINSVKSGVSQKLRELRVTFLKVSLLFNLPVSLAFIFFARPITSVFTSDLTITNILMKIMLLSAIFLIFDTVQMILTDCIRAFENNNELLIVTLSLSILLFIPLSYFLSFVLKFGIYGMWLSFYFYLIVQALVLNHLYSKEIKHRVTK